MIVSIVIDIIYLGQIFPIQSTNGG